MDYLVRFMQIHEDFHRAELESLATLASVDLRILEYSADSPFCVVRLASEDAACRLITRSVLASGIYELWGSGQDYITLHEDIRMRTSNIWSQYRESSFRFTVNGYQGKRNQASQAALIDSFAYLGFNGPIRMHDAELSMCIFEDYEWQAPSPKRIFLGRWIAGSDRAAVSKYDLKKRHYISTTSMDAELALVTANLVQARPAMVVYDPFVGTASLLIACAHFGSLTIGSDIDGRSVRGKAGRHVVSNYQQYGLLHRYLDGFISDLTHCPLRQTKLLDGIVCDPPYGVREGLRVLGTRDGSGKEEVIIDGIPAHFRPGYIPPKKPYSFDAMLDDILDFAATMLVSHGRLCMWVPSANEDEVELAIPSHPALELIAVCVQPFNKWSRRLLTYKRLADADIRDQTPPLKRQQELGANADELNTFRKRYFEGFRVLSSDQ